MKTLKMEFWLEGDSTSKASVTQEFRIFKAKETMAKRLVEFLMEHEVKETHTLGGIELSFEITLVSDKECMLLQELLNNENNRETSVVECC